MNSFNIIKAIALLIRTTVVQNSGMCTIYAVCVHETEKKRWV